MISLVILTGEEIRFPSSFYVVCEYGLKQSGWIYDTYFSISEIEVYFYDSDPLFM